MQPIFRSTLLKELDSSIDKLQASRRATARPSRGWLKAVREAIGLTHASVAKKLGITRQAFAELEERETNGTITVESLRRAANALDCELIYCLLPQADVADTFTALAAQKGPAARQLKAAAHSMMLEGQGVENKVDGKNIGLVRSIAWLRQNLELYELVTVNVENLKKVNASEALFAHIQRLAMEAIALTLCKIYEPERRHELNSIAGVINSLPDAGPYSDAQMRSTEQFAAKHGIRGNHTEPKAFLHKTLLEFLETHDEAFQRLRRFRDKFASHSEHNFELGPLPSFDEFEALYGFAYDFYRLISESFLNVGPALIHLYVRNGFVRLLKRLGIEDPSPGFPR